MPVKIVGAAFPRTGTMSVKIAIEKLGVGACYHMHELFLNPPHIEIWKRVYIEPKSIDFHNLFEGYVATLDGPACLHWREIASAFPEAVVLLLCRGPADWYSSFMSTIYQVITAKPNEPALKLIKHQLLDTFFEGRIDDEAFAVSKFQAYLDAVRTEVPADRLIEYRVADGWKPLCDALGLPVPDEPFPRVNTRDIFMKRNRLS